MMLPVMQRQASSRFWLLKDPIQQVPYVWRAILRLVEGTKIRSSVSRGEDCAELSKGIGQAKAATITRTGGKSQRTDRMRNIR
jgi:hypothetical protein